MIIKLICSLIIIISCTLLGIKYGENLRKRVEELNSLLQAVNQMKVHIQYTFTPIPEILNDIAKKSSEPLATIFNNISEKLFLNAVDSIHEAFIEELSKENHELHLKNDDTEILLDLAKSLGDTDVEGQSNVLNLIDMKLKKQIKSAETELEKNLKVYRYLGFSIGATIVILII
ncbi:stage III sporulation protein SpoIIIAB [Clostridium sediminicola]|uniref:stage III sporulation protein SpoIIIAB n=1 Tax=Clostridium sediminicola TaxID=3114879 RepID=UPI0031F23842